MDKAQMQKVAKSAFERYNDKDKVFVTSDGQAFFDEACAKNHSVKNRTGKELSLEVFRRDEQQSSKSAALSANDFIAELATLETIEEVQAVLETEKAGKKRKTVIEACEKRIEELKAQ